jgi:pSer/pThr/pTyr-binding forkhead associated (FHA) protein
MAKIILTIDDTILQELTLSKERVTIGRRAHNDIVIDDLAISGEHAVIVTANDDSFLEDLNSTNGTQINGQPVKKHFLQDGDVVEMAQYKLRYIADGHPARGEGAEAATASSGIAASQNVATLKVMNGPNAGKEIALTKVLTTLGHPGVEVAVITQRSQSYYIEHVEGGSYLLVNGKSANGNAHLIADGDVIDLSGTQMAFSQP